MYCHNDKDGVDRSLYANRKISDLKVTKLCELREHRSMLYRFYTGQAGSHRAAQVHRTTHCAQQRAVSVVVEDWAQQRPDGGELLRRTHTADCLLLDAAKGRGGSSARCRRSRSADHGRVRLLQRRPEPICRGYLMEASEQTYVASGRRCVVVVPRGIFGVSTRL